MRPSNNRILSNQFLFPCCLAFFFGGLYIWTASRYLVGGDGGLFTLVAATGGYGHPPGYPLYSLYLHLVTHLFAVDIPHGAALATALIGVGAISVLYGACRAWGFRVISSLFVAIAFGLSSHVWLFHTEPEVFALNHLIAAAILYGVSPNSYFRGWSRVIFLGLMAGLGLCNHHVIVLLAPIGLYGVWRGTKEYGSYFIPMALGLTGLLVGLCFYAYPIWVAINDVGWYWGDASSLSGLIDLFLRKDYGTFSLSTTTEDISSRIHIVFLAESVLEDMFYVVPVLSVFGLGISVYDDFGTSKPLSPDFWRKTWLIVSMILVGPVFVSLFNMKPAGVTELVIRRHHLLFQLLLAFGAGFGIDWLIRRTYVRARLIAGLMTVLILGGLFSGWKLLRNHRGPQIEQYVKDSVQLLPENAVILGSGDHVFSAFTYSQKVWGMKKNVVYIHPQMSNMLWYIKRLNRRLGQRVFPLWNDIGAGKLFDRIHQLDRPLLITHPFIREINRRPSIPYGPLILVKPLDKSTWPPKQLYRRNLELLSELSIQPTRHVSKHSWKWLVLDRYSYTWQVIETVLRRAGETKLADKADQIENSFMLEN